MFPDINLDSTFQINQKSLEATLLEIAYQATQMNGRHTDRDTGRQDFYVLAQLKLRIAVSRGGRFSQMYAQVTRGGLGC